MNVVKLYYRNDLDNKIKHIHGAVMYPEMDGIRYPPNTFNLYSRNINFRIDLFKGSIKSLKEMIKSGTLTPDELQQCKQNLAYTQGRLEKAKRQ